MKRPRDLANRSRDLGDLSKVKNDDFLRETFTLSLPVARLKARQILDAYRRPPTETLLRRMQFAV